MTGDLMCQIEGEDLVIRLPIGALASSAECWLPDALGIDPETCSQPIKVTDQRVWAQEIART
ncbi:hypothetical protein AU476_07410 [Cupriavidus sp. UYMSc13B]|nr:hypothetical protein AU476_07410 [Cupriavidus sp. UYMSc13B]